MSSVWLPVSGPNEERERIVRGEGAYIYNAEGKSYFDGNSGLWNTPLGYANQGIRDYVLEQMDKLSFANPEMFSNDMEEKLADKILAIMPDNMKQVYFTCTGSECTEVAIKVSRKFQRLCRKPRKMQIAVFNQSYHGNYFGAMSASCYETEFRNQYKPLLDGFIELPLPFSREKEANLSDICADIKNQLEENKNTLAAIFLEPILGSAGVLPIPGELLKWISEFAAKNNILLVFDEISTGMGRTGKMFAFEHYGIKPDMVLLSKGINNGYLPFGAVVLSSKISSAFRMRGDILFHLSTQNGNPICCAAAVETIRQITENDCKLVHEVEQKGLYLKERLMEELRESKHFYDVRGMGLMVAVELTERDGETMLNQEKLYQIVLAMKEKGLLCSWNYTEEVTSCVYFMIPYIVSMEELEFVVTTMKDVLMNFECEN